MGEVDRTYPDRPWVGVGVIVFRGDEILLVRRGKPPNQGQWSLPGGGQDLGETVFEAARREVAEEAGIDMVRPVEVLTTVDSVHRDDGRARQIPLHACRGSGRSGRTATSRAGDDAGGCSLGRCRRGGVPSW